MVALRQEGSDMLLVQAQQLEITEISNMTRLTIAVEQLSALGDGESTVCTLHHPYASRQPLLNSNPALNVGDSTVCTLHHPHAYPLPQNT